MTVLKNLIFNLNFFFGEMFLIRTKIDIEMKISHLTLFRISLKKKNCKRLETMPGQDPAHCNT